MVEDALVTADLEEGRAVLNQLAREHFPVRAAALVHESDLERWRLYLVTPVKKHQLAETYRRVSEAILADPDQKDQLKHVSFKIVDAREPLGKTLIDWAKVAGRTNRRMFGPTSKGELVDAVVYGEAA